MTEGTGPADPNAGAGQPWASPGAAWQAGPPAQPYDAYQQPVWSPAGQSFTGPGQLPGPKRNRKPLIIGLVAGAVVLVIALVVGIVLVVSSSGGSGSPGDAVKAYLQALADGKADKALSYSSDQPGSKRFLTDEILQQQIDKWPITEIKILDGDKGSLSYGMVHVSAKFGDKTSDTTISVKKSNKKWKLEHGAIKLDSSSALSSNKGAYQTLTLFGEKVGDEPAYFFPGWVDAGSDNANLKVNVKEPFLLDGLASYSLYYGSLEFQISDKGSSAISSAISSTLQACTRSNQLSPANCPQSVYRYDLVDGTVTWGTPDLSGIKADYISSDDLEVRFSGQVIFPLTAQTRSGGTWSGNDTEYVYGTADLSTSPPKVTIS